MIENRAREIQTPGFENMFSETNDLGKSVWEKTILGNRCWKRIDFGKSILENRLTVPWVGAAAPHTDHGIHDP